MAKSKFFRAFVEGNTISDGRQITAQMIDEVVATFSADTYTPRINVEHIAGYSPEPPFNGYGSVVAVKAQDDEITIAGKTETRKALYCQVDGNDQLVALAKKDQKPFPSVELTDSYAGSGKVGLVGLAFTDRPASIATQKLQFSRNAPGTVHALSEDAGTLEFEAAPTDSNAIVSAIKAGFASLAGTFGSKSEQKPAEQPGPKTPANDNDFATFATAIGEQVATAITAATKPQTEAIATLQTEFATMKGQLEKTEQPGFSRQVATGGTGKSVATDC